MVPSRSRQQKQVCDLRRLSVGSFGIILVNPLCESFEGAWGNFSKSSPTNASPDSPSFSLFKIRHNVVRVLCRDTGDGGNLLTRCFFEGGESAEGCEELFGFGVTDAGDFGKG